MTPLLDSLLGLLRPITFRSHWLRQSPSLRSLALMQLVLIRCSCQLLSGGPRFLLSSSSIVTNVYIIEIRPFFRGEHTIIIGSSLWCPYCFLTFMLHLILLFLTLIKTYNYVSSSSPCKVPALYCQFVVYLIPKFLHHMLFHGVEINCPFP